MVKMFHTIYKGHIFFWTHYFVDWFINFFGWNFTHTQPWNYYIPQYHIPVTMTQVGVSSKSLAILLR